MLTTNRLERNKQNNGKKTHIHCTLGILFFTMYMIVYKGALIQIQVVVIETKKVTIAIHKGNCNQFNVH